MAELVDANDIMFTPFEPKLKNRFMLNVDGVPAYLIKTANRPQITFEEVTLEHMNVKRYVKGKAAWQTLQCTLYDPVVPSAAQAVMEWVRLSHESVTGRDGYSDFYKKDVNFQVLGPVGDIVEESTFIGPQMSGSSPAVAELPYETIEGSEYLPAGYGDQPQVAGGAGGGGYFDNLLGGRSFGDIMSQGASNMLQGLYTTGSLLGGMSNPYNKKGGGLIEGLMPRGYQDGGEVADTLAHIDWGDSSVVSMTPRQSEIFDLATNRINFAPNTSKKAQLETLVDMMNNPKFYGWDKELKESKFIGPKQTSKKGIEPHYNFQDGGQVGYGTATNPQDALRQMGMGDVADDPRLEKYLEDLPQFGMGYKQQLGDITAGARSSLMDISQQGRMQQAGTGFAGGGAGAMGQSRAREGLQRQFGTQRRSLVEGYQADLLSAIADIEGKGGFEFGSTTGGADTRAGGVFDDAPISDENWNPPMNPTEGATYNFMGDEYIFTGGNWVTQESYQGQGE